MLTPVEAEPHGVLLDLEGLVGAGLPSQEDLYTGRPIFGGHVALELIAIIL